MMGFWNLFKSRNAQSPEGSASIPTELTIRRIRKQLQALGFKLGQNLGYELLTVVSSRPQPTPKRQIPWFKAEDQIIFEYPTEGGVTQLVGGPEIEVGLLPEQPIAYLRLSDPRWSSALEAANLNEDAHNDLVNRLNSQFKFVKVQQQELLLETYLYGFGGLTDKQLRVQLKASLKNLAQAHQALTLALHPAANTEN
ncbi:hypothetical protein [Boudabousia liubingyangii]|uniref:hypothetical protein n=1 Tax=Boudabousia liubingyangii TaxID=1921764 RepID=UPI0011785EC7|nr:hypothetical protein [Boudabousia liubingyangii]